MKDLNSYIQESILTKTSTKVSGFNPKYRDEVEMFIKQNYKTIRYVISEEPNEDGLYEVSAKGKVRVLNSKITSLTNGMFTWTVVGSFVCALCSKLTSLEGSPKEVRYMFNCSHCKNLESLKGISNKIGGDFKCYNCKGKFTKEDVPNTCKVKGGIYTTNNM